ncbi:MAG: glutamine-hydrolyzing synthase [Haloplasmataceae bacterium]|jgi:GMP synthase (glutamine-hydrolysing)|nr:glutamine-hydrolyzing synthase [Haloplasmataceae bacterium]
MHLDKIIVLDYGSQYNQLIARRIREFGVFSELLSHEISATEIKNMPNIKGIILSGGPNSVYEENSFGIDSEILNLGIPILGICYGMQLTVDRLGGHIQKANHREYGKSPITLVEENSLLFSNLPKTQNVWMSHGDQVVTLPSGFKVLASSETCPYAAVSNEKEMIYAVQFHPEVRHTEYGNQILNNFVFKICESEANWNMGEFIDKQIEVIRETVGDKKVLLGLSGGVDSSVAAVLIHKAIGNNLFCIFVDHGLLRKDEAKQVMETFAKGFNINIIKVDAKVRFLSKLKGVSDPELKRKIIGNEFVYVFDEESKKLGDYDFLAQGTLYTDIVESGTKTAQTIKSHHNVGGLPKEMKFKLIEPLKTLFKDEVRALGEKLGIPHEIVWRQPFPGPGLGIRVIGDVTETKLYLVRESDAILREEIIKAKLENDVWQYFTVLSNIQTVGVMGDQRTYDYTIGIRAVTSIDGMTADWARLPWEVLDKISRRIVNEVKGINRVVYDITSKPPATIEWE